MKSFQRFALGCAWAGLNAAAVAGTGEFCTLPNAQGVQTTYECAVKFSAQSTWLSSFKTWLNSNKTSGAMACFAPGTYTVPSTLLSNVNYSNDANRLVLRGVSGLRLCAPAGAAVVEHKTVNADGSPLANYAYMPTLQIVASSNVAIKGMSFKNTSVYAAAFLHHVTRAVWADNSSNLRFVDTQFSGLGKQVLHGKDSVVNLTASSVNCAYFCISGERGTGATKPSFTVANSQFNINRLDDTADDHTALWTDYSDFFIADSSFNYTTGQGLVSGQASTVDWVNLSNISVSGATAQGRPKMFGWIATHPNYHNLQISYTGTPPVSRAYYCVVATDNPGCDTGHENAGALGAVFRSRPNTSSAFVVAPLPPSKTKSLLLLNGSGADALWSQNRILRNGAALTVPVLQDWQGMAAALGGWLDAGDQVLTGDFLVPGQARVLFFNSEALGGAISVRALGGSGASGTMSTDTWIDWTPALATTLGGWHDANDKLLAGDFTGLGRAHLLFMNVDGAGGAFYMAAIDAANSQLQGLAVVPWSAALSSSLVGWMDAGDKLVAGDFSAAGRAQLLFLNADGGAQGAASLRQYDAASNAFQIVATVPWHKIIGNTQIWTQASAKVLSGDFLGLNKDQLVFVNPTGSGVALSFWSFDGASGNFTEIYKMNYGAGEITSLNGYVESNDWQLGF
jgi:hypothetical protein